MAPTLQEFNKKPSAAPALTMESFQPVQRPSPAANPETINNIASYGAALDMGGQVEETYKSITNQLNYSSSSPTLDSIITKWQENDVQGSMDALRSVLVDPEIPQEQKTEILYEFQNGRSGKSLAQMAGEAALIDGDAGENGEQADIRELLATAYNEVNQYNAWTQQQINALNSEANPHWTTNVKSMVQSFIPFADAADQAFFENAIGGLDEAGGVGNTVQTLLLLGEGRDRLRKTLGNVPIEKRREVISGIINTIKTTSGNLAHDTVTLRAIQNLEKLIVPGAYNDNDKFWDNAFSVLDDTVILSPLSRGIRGAGRALRGADEVRVAQNVQDIAARSETLLLEHRITAPNWSADVDNIIDALPIEATGSDITQLRTLINNQINNANFSIDDIINEARITDNLTASQIIDVRQGLGNIRDKRVAYTGQDVPTVTPPTIAEARARHVSSNVQPTSPHITYKDTNVTKARASHNLIVADDTGQVARITAGTTRDNVLAHDYLPEIGGNGRVQNKVEFDEATSTPDASILSHASKSEQTASWLSKAEVAEARKRVINDWKNVMGLKNRSAMATIEDLGFESTTRGVRINQVYGPENGGFSNAYTAIDVTRAALRKYGVKDDELTVLARQPDGTYAPATNKHDLTNGDYLVQVKYDYFADPKEVSFDGYDVGRFWKFFRIPDINFLNREGGFIQQLIPKSVNIDPRTYVSGVAAADRASGLQKQFLVRGKDFANKFNKLDKVQKAKVDEYIRYANENEIRFNSAQIRARGISEEGLEALSVWKRLQDTLHYLENLDVARGLRDRGYELFEHRGTDTRVIVERVARSNPDVAPTSRFYDPAADEVVSLSSKELDELYAKEGAIMRMRQPSSFNGEEVAFIVNRNSPNTGFARRIRDDDRILNYRHGYYHVKYTDPYYITKIDEKTGRVQTIARAEGNRDALVEAQRLNDTKDGFRYEVKRDNAAESFENNLDVATNYGRSAQRVRGKRLDRVGGANDKTISDQGIESPIDSLTRSVASISHRTSFRNVIDAEKRRWMSQWKDLMPRVNGVPTFPNTVDEILKGPGATEARHAFRHLEQLQSGYGNLLDDMAKAFFNNVSEFAGSKGWDWIDKVASKLAKVSPTGAARLTAFKLFLAANPVRQLPLQALPAVVIISSLNPGGWGRVLKHAGVLGAWHRGIDLSATNKIAKFGLDQKEMKDMLEAYTLSGMDAAVNAHVYLRDQVGRMADVSVAQKAMSLLGKPLRIAQNIGFDFGEQSLMTLTWLSEYDRLTRKLGRTKLNGTERDELVGKVRALTGDMNKGGDMPYNSNSFSVVMQFMQTPHKIASGLLLGHRGLTGVERAKLAAGYTAAFGIPVLPFLDKFVDGVLPADDAETRDIIKGGLTNMVLNNFLSSLSGQKVRTEFSKDLNPFTTEPLIDMVSNLLKLNMQDFLSDTAAVSLFTENGRINNFLKASLDWAIPGSYENVDEAKQVGLTFMQLFSGTSNILKAMYILENGKITTASGQVVDEDVSYVEALLKAAGFQTMDEVYYWAGNETEWEISGKIDDDVEKLVDQLFTRWARENTDPSELSQFHAVLKSAAHIFNDRPALIEKVGDYYAFKTRQNPDALYQKLLTSGLYDPEQMIKIINNSNFSQEKRDTLLEMVRIAGESYGS